MAPSYAELAEQVITIRSQAQALVGSANTLLRALQPLVESEGTPEQTLPGRRVFGKRETVLRGGDEDGTDPQAVERNSST